ncbi:unnamed protein product [Gordionus sp. m RMFG-2023]
MILVDNMKSRNNGDNEVSLLREQEISFRLDTVNISCKNIKCSNWRRQSSTASIDSAISLASAFEPNVVLKKCQEAHNDDNADLHYAQTRKRTSKIRKANSKKNDIVNERKITNSLDNNDSDSGLGADVSSPAYIDNQSSICLSLETDSIVKFDLSPIQSNCKFPLCCCKYSNFSDIFYYQDDLRQSYQYNLPPQFTTYLHGDDGSMLTNNKGNIPADLSFNTSHDNSVDFKYRFSNNPYLNNDNKPFSANHLNYIYNKKISRPKFVCLWKDCRPTRSLDSYPQNIPINQSYYSHPYQFEFFQDLVDHILESHMEPINHKSSNNLNPVAHHQPFLKRVKEKSKQSLTDKLYYACYWSKCKYYAQPVTSLNWMRRHIMYHVSPKPYKCIIGGCGAAFKFYVSLEKHLNCKHLGKRNDKYNTGSRFLPNTFDDNFYNNNNNNTMMTTHLECNNKRLNRCESFIAHQNNNAAYDIGDSSPNFTNFPKDSYHYQNYGPTLDSNKKFGESAKKADRARFQEFWREVKKQRKLLGVKVSTKPDMQTLMDVENLLTFSNNSTLSGI